MDAIAVLKADHKTVEALFKDYEAAGPRAYKAKRKLVDEIISELAVHAAIEEQVFYPNVREAVKALNGTILEGIEEHHIVKWTLSELEHLEPGAENFDAKVNVLMEVVRHHVKEEESEVFPEVRKQVSRGELNDWADLLDTARQSAPTHPHPRAPSTPPANIVTGALAGLVDKAKDITAGALGR